LSITRPFDSSPALYYNRSVVTMRLSGTITEIWRLRYWTHGKKDGRKERERKGRGREGKSKVEVEKGKEKRKGRGREMERGRERKKGNG